MASLRVNGLPTRSRSLRCMQSLASARHRPRQVRGPHLATLQSTPLGRLPMRNGKGGLVRHKARCWVSRKQTKQNGPFATKHGHSLETTRREFVPEQPRVLDVDISQPIAPYVPIHDSSPRSPPSSSLKTPVTRPRFRARLSASVLAVLSARQPPEVCPAPHCARRGGPAEVKSGTSDFGGHRFRRPRWLLRVRLRRHTGISSGGST